MLSNFLSEDFYKWFRKFSAPLPEDINDYVSPEKNFIDIGAGNGFFLSRITSTTHRAAVEVWDKQIAYLHERFPDVPVYNSIFNVPETYDVVACMDVLHHIVDEPAREQFLAKLLEIVKPGGMLILKDMRDDLLLHKYFNRLSDYVSTKSHVREMNPERLLKLLAASGFTVTKFCKYTALLYGHYYIAARRTS